jgi:serine/threonine-protein kinase
MPDPSTVTAPAGRTPPDDPTTAGRPTGSAPPEGSGPARPPGERVTEIGGWEPIDTGWHPVALVVGVLAVVALYLLAAAGLGSAIESGDKRVDIADVTVPSVVGLSEDEAIARLESEGIIVVVEEGPNEVVAPGAVFEQRPIAGAKVELGSPVTVLVSTGPAGVTVPVLEGQQSNEAVALLRTLGLAGEVVPTPDEQVRPGEVTGSTPDAGRSVPPGGTVRLAVSTGPAPRTVPAFEGRPVTDVAAELGRLGLVVGDVTRRATADVPEGTVLAMSATPGTQVPRGTSVDLTVAQPATLPIVPWVEGLLRSTAVEALTAADVPYQLRQVSLPVGDPRSGRVLRQGIPGGAGLPAGVTVEVVVGVAPPPPTTVPPTTVAPAPAAPTTTLPG